MAQYRALEPVSYVKDGKVVSVKAGKHLELDEIQAAALAGRVAPVLGQGDSMFPGGAPIIPVSITRNEPPVPVTGEPDPLPAPVKKPSAK